MIIKVRVEASKLEALHRALLDGENYYKSDAPLGNFVWIEECHSEPMIGTSPVPYYNVTLEVLEGYCEVSGGRVEFVHLSKLTRVLQAVGLYPNEDQPKA